MARSILRSGSGASTALSPSVRAMTTKSRLPRSSATARAMRSLPTISLTGISDLDIRIEVHVGRAQVADGKGIAAEVDRLEAVVHDELGAHRVVYARPEQEWLGVK